MKTKILIIGASVRAQVQSAIRSGYAFEAWDLFADHDTREACEKAVSKEASIKQIESFDEIAKQIALRRHASKKNDPKIVIVCGGVEQHEASMTAIADWLPVAGCSAESLYDKSDWKTLARLFDKAGCESAPTFDHLPAGADAKQWLRKPVRGSGGLNIRVANASEVNEKANSRGFRYQQRIDGDSFSSLYVAGSHHTNLIGITQQLVGDPRFTNSPFAYCGSIGPIRLSNNHERKLSSLGELLTEQFHFRGIFGVDFIVNDRGIWPVDVNNRITSSAEVFETFDLATKQRRAFNMIDAHLGVVDSGIYSMDNVEATDQVCGKAVVFNQTGRSIRVTGKVFAGLLALTESGTLISDIPKAGVVVGPDEPIVTVHSIGDKLASAEKALAVSANRIQGLFRESSADALEQP